MKRNKRTVMMLLLVFVFLLLSLWCGVAVAAGGVLVVGDICARYGVQCGALLADAPPAGPVSRHGYIHGYRTYDERKKCS